MRTPLRLKEIQMNAETDTESLDRGEKAKPSERSGAAGAAQLRDRIDRGAGGDKVAFQDPAAAPLGTDDEAAGTPPSARQVSTAMLQEANRSASADRKPSPADLQGDRSQPRSSWLIIAGLLALVAVIIALIVV